MTTVGIRQTIQEKAPEASVMEWLAQKKRWQIVHFSKYKHKIIHY